MVGFGEAQVGENVREKKRGERNPNSSKISYPIKFDLDLIRLQLDAQILFLMVWLNLFILFNFFKKYLFYT